MAKDIKDSMGLGDSAGEVLAEVLGGIFNGLQSKIEVTDDGSHVIIGSADYDWALTLRKVPKVEESAKKEAVA